MSQPKNVQKAKSIISAVNIQIFLLGTKNAQQKCAKVI